MKQCIALFIVFFLCVSTASTALSVDSPAFSVKINGMLDADISFNDQNTLIISWQIMANQSGLTLRNTQGLRLAYDNTILQLMKWDSSDVIADSGTGTTFSVVSQAGCVGVYSASLRVSAAKSTSGNQGYLNISPGSNYETYTCSQGSFVILAQVRFAFRSGKSATDLTENSIRCMNVSELAATAQSSAILINTTENEITSYEYLKQENGAATGGDKLNAPIISYPFSGADNTGSIDETLYPVGSDTPDNATEQDVPEKSTKQNPPVNPNQPEIPDSVNLDTPINPTDTYMASDYNNPFTDVPTDAWFYSAVCYVAENNLMNGMGNNIFSPDTTMTRAMFATILHRLAGTPYTNGKGTFIDVDDDQWYTDAIHWASRNSIILGYGNGRFGTNDSITREQAVTLLYRYYDVMELRTGNKANLSTYTDVSKISPWALTTMQMAVDSGIITGRTSTALVPQGHMTRAEVAQMLLNFNSIQQSK